MARYDYDVIIIGGGSGGLAASGIAKGMGKKTAIVEKNKLGGDCTWYGCVPSKALIKSAQLAHLIQTAGDYGIHMNHNGKYNTRHVMSHVRNVIRKIYEAENQEAMERKGIRVFLGTPRFLNPHEIKVNGTSVSAEKFIISTGSHPIIPSIEGLETVLFLTNENLFDLEELPETMLILGGGPIGVEMAAALNRLGVKINLIESADRILKRDDPELTTLLMAQLQKEGIDVLTKHRAVQFKKTAEVIEATLRDNEGKTKTMRTDSLLVAVGRQPNVDGMDLEKAGVVYSSSGIRVNNKLQTSARNIYAIGDVLGGYQFSHIAEYQATVAVRNGLLPLPVKKKIDYKNVVWCTFTDPELAHAGLTEPQARERFGDRIRIYRHHYAAADRPRTDLCETGVSKFITNRKGKLLGIHILGHRAAALLHEAQLAKYLGVKFARISGMIHIYPTYGELVKRPADKSYVDNLQNNVFVKLAQKIIRGN